MIRWPPDPLALQDDLRHAAALLGHHDAGYGGLCKASPGRRRIRHWNRPQHLRHTGLGTEDLRKLLAARIARPTGPLIAP